MNILLSLHGVAALVLLCSLLFAEEAGIPLPLMPGDAILILGGLLIGNGSLSPWLFLPCACLATLAGALTAYTWARVLGSRGLEALAQRLRAVGALHRASARVRRSGPVGILICRLLPGLRIYSTMVAGAVGLDIRLFLAGVVPSILLWVGGFTLLGFFAGVPAEHILSHVQRLVAEGALLAGIGVVAYTAVRRIPPTERAHNALRQAPRRWRLVVSLAVDVGIVTCVVSGMVEVAQDLLGLPDPTSVIEIAVLVFAITLVYIAVGRRAAGGTAGESLLNITYGPWHRV